MNNGTKIETFQDVSRKNWTPNEEDEKSIDTIRMGALLRIADASEAIAENFLKMKNRIEQLEQNVEYLREVNYRKYDQINGLERSNAALRGHITRLKRKIQVLEISDSVQL